MQIFLPLVGVVGFFWWRSNAPIRAVKAFIAEERRKKLRKDPDFSFPVVVKMEQTKVPEGTCIIVHMKDAYGDQFKRAVLVTPDNQVLPIRN